MGVTKYIWRKGQRYYLYGKYDNYAELKRDAMREKRRNKCKYFIITTETDGFISHKQYLLYLNRCIRIGF